MNDEINNIEESAANIDKNLSREELLQRYAEVNGVSIEDAEKEVGAESLDEMLKNIEDKTLQHIREKQPPMNRAQRRALKKKLGAKKYAEMVGENGDVVEAVTETAKKLNYIDLIQKLRKLNEEKENENGETTIENN